MCKQRDTQLLLPAGTPGGAVVTRISRDIHLLHAAYLVTKGFETYCGETALRKDVALRITPKPKLATCKACKSAYEELRGTDHEGAATRGIPENWDAMSPAERRHRKAECAGRIRYDSLEDAERELIRHGADAWVDAYKCPWCPAHHLGREPVSPLFRRRRNGERT